MDTENFLARVTAPGNYTVIAWAKPGSTDFFHRFFPAARAHEAGGFARYMAKVGNDAYHAMASYTTAIADGQDKLGKPKFRGKRTQENAQRLKAFWLDMDVSRPGDRKDPKRVFASKPDALTWLAGFLKVSGLPKPNLAVSSGYGIHVYWLLEDDLAVADWQPYADALKAALLKHGFTGDAGLSADSARILRPPGTQNFKAGAAAPAAVAAIPRLTAVDYPNHIVLAALQPYVGLLAKPQVQTQVNAQASAQAAQAGGQASALAGGGGSNVQSIFAGAGGNMAANTQTNLPARARPREFARIATQCEQVKASLANHGLGDPRPLWLLGHLTLASHCVDGSQFIHPISDGDPRYTAHETDTEFARVGRDHQRKGFGPPSCAHFETTRQAVCLACPFHGKVHSPWDLGIEDGDLPDYFRRGPRGIEAQIKTKDGPIWVLVLAGDVSGPILDEAPFGGYALTFAYLRAGKTRMIRAQDIQLKPDSSAIFGLFAPQGVTLLPGAELHWRGFCLGWMDKLREQRAERTEVIHPFGWAHDSKGTHIGFAVGGTLYRADGREEATPGGDPQLVHTYRPLGELTKWQEACDFVGLNRLDLQTIIAASFGAPLMVFTGHAGVAVSAWSRNSAVGKSSAIKVGQSVWSAAISMNTLDDTNNFVFAKIAQSRAMPCFWDEMKVGSENSDKMVSMALSLSQGKGKGRLNADSSLREVGEWDTILISASNYPLMDHIVAKTDGTDAGAVRLFEFNITVPPAPDTSKAARTIAQTKHNYGHAGRLYAKWIAENYSKTDDIVCKIKDLLNKELKAEQAERFYIAGMASILAGAKIANHLKLTKFDVPGLKAFLCTEFLRMRRTRQTAVLVNSAGYDLEQVLGSFMADGLRHKLVTQWFATAGPKKLPADFVRWYPQDRNRVDMHIAQHEKILRINRAVLNEWCRKRNLPASDVIEAMGSVWGASGGRRTMAGGTGFGGGQVYCVDVPLVVPELAGYLFVDPAAAAQQLAQSTIPAPGPAPGNRPKV